MSKNIITAPILYAMAHGLNPEEGQERCFYCGALCGLQYQADVKSSFNDWDQVEEPQSDYRCAGCEMTMKESDDSGRLEKCRNFSWIITATKLLRVSKGDRGALRAACLAPPDPPYVIAIAVSGQRHILYKSRVALGGGMAIANLEGEPICYEPAVLADRMKLAESIAAAAGRPAMTGRLETSAAIAVFERYPSRAEEIIDQWARVWSEPLSRLAAYLTPKKEDLQNDYPGESSTPRKPAPGKSPERASAQEHAEHGLFSA